jgi:hypothetical protein
MANLARRKSELVKTAAPSSMDLVLAQNLDRISQIYKTEQLPGEIRVWQNSFAKEPPETVAWAFAEYFKTGKFPPKPADIAAMIEQRRGATQAMLPEFKPCGKCNFGWIYTFKEGKSVGTVRACECRKAWVASVK